MTELMDGLHLHEEAVSAEMQADLLAFVEAQLSDGRHGTGALTPKTYTVPAQPLPPLPSPSISPSALPAAPEHASADTAALTLVISSSISSRRRRTRGSRAAR